MVFGPSNPIICVLGPLGHVSRAEDGGHVEVAEVLLEAGADAETRSF